MKFLKSDFNEIDLIMQEVSILFSVYDSILFVLFFLEKKRTKRKAPSHQIAGGTLRPAASDLALGVG
jgi:hypothetical protein